MAQTNYVLSKELNSAVHRQLTRHQQGIDHIDPDDLLHPAGLMKSYIKYSVFHNMHLLRNPIYQILKGLAPLQWLSLSIGF